MKAKHTPTPWIINRFGGVTEEGEEWQEKIVLDGFSLSGVGNHQAVSNTRHIVKCVNAHEALVDAVKQLLWCMSVAGWENDPASINAREALKLAGEENELQAEQGIKEPA